MFQDSSTPYAMSTQAPLSFRAEGYEYDHEVLVTLPPSYSVSADRSYFVLWAMDGAMQHMLIAGIVNMYIISKRLPEMIVISVGHSSEQGMAGLIKREYDLLPPGSTTADDDTLAASLKANDGGLREELSKHFKADKFQDFLIDQLRPQLAERYRMNGDHALVGFSSGGYFAGYSMFSRPGAFSRYLIGSGTHPQTPMLEAQYAESHSDLVARVFLGAGSREVSDLNMSASRIVSRTVYLAENLRMRQYPSLALKTQIYTDRDHLTVMAPLLADGVEYLYANEFEEQAGRMNQPGDSHQSESSKHD